MAAKFFKTPAAWRAWLEKHHGSAQELTVGFYKKGSGRASITWPESVDGALCFGWIDGVRHGLDSESYCIRFTPRRKRSIWSAVNLNRVAELSAQGLMHASGVKAFEAREESRSKVYAFEQTTVEFEGTFKQRFEANAAAWAYFSSRPAGYRKTATWFVLSAKQEATRQRRLDLVIRHSGQGEPIPHLNRNPKASS